MIIENLLIAQKQSVQINLQKAEAVLKLCKKESPRYCDYQGRIWAFKLVLNMLESSENLIDEVISK